MCTCKSLYALYVGAFVPTSGWERCDAASVKVVHSRGVLAVTGASLFSYMLSNTRGFSHQVAGAFSQGGQDEATTVEVNLAAV
jgi:hypothetical protein